jgi:hypothetical protein
VQKEEVENEEMILMKLLLNGFIADLCSLVMCDS